MILVSYRVAPCHGHVVHDPVVLVVHEHPLPQLSDLLLVVRVGGSVLFRASNLTASVFAKCDFIRRGSDPLAEDNLSQVLCW